MEKTVKAHEIKNITAKELFSMTYGTRELYSDQQIETLKTKITNRIKMKMASVEFYENDGVVYYAHTFVEPEGPNKGDEITTINYIKDYSVMSAGELWKFGFLNKKTGEITLLFGGNCVAKGRSEAFKFFEIAKIVTTHKFKNSSDLVPFAHKD